jgi:hypothetical protein
VAARPNNEGGKSPGVPKVLYRDSAVPCVFFSLALRLRGPQDLNYSGAPFDFVTPLPITAEKQYRPLTMYYRPEMTSSVRFSAATS